MHSLDTDFLALLRLNSGSTSSLLRQISPILECDLMRRCSLQRRYTGVERVDDWPLSLRRRFSYKLRGYLPVRPSQPLRDPKTLEIDYVALHEKWLCETTVR